MRTSLILFFVFFADIVMQQDQMKTLALLTQRHADRQHVVLDDLKLVTDAGETGSDAPSRSLVVEFDGRVVVVGGQEPVGLNEAIAQLPSAAMGRDVELRLDHDVRFADYWQLRTALGGSPVHVATTSAANRRGDSLR